MNLPNSLMIVFIVAMTALIACNPKKAAKDNSPEGMMAREIRIAQLYKASNKGCIVPLQEVPEKAADLMANLQVIQFCSQAANSLTEAALADDLTVDQAFISACVSSTIELVGVPADDATQKNELNFCAKQLDEAKKAK